MAIPMPLTTDEKGERFHACCLLRNSNAFFSFIVCSKTNHSGGGAWLHAINPLAIIVLETLKIGRWQFMSYAV